MVLITYYIRARTKSQCRSHLVKTSPPTMIRARLDRRKVGPSIIPAPLEWITDRKGGGQKLLKFSGMESDRVFPLMCSFLKMLNVEGDVDSHPMISSFSLSRSARNNRGARREKSRFDRNNGAMHRCSRNTHGGRWGRGGGGVERKRERVKQNRGRVTNLSSPPLFGL